MNVYLPPGQDRLLIAEVKHQDGTHGRLYYDAEGNMIEDRPTCPLPVPGMNRAQRRAAARRKSR